MAQGGEVPDYEDQASHLWTPSPIICARGC